MLLEGGAKVNAKETLRGTTALMWAAEQKHPEAVKALLTGGADFAAKSGGAGLPRNYLAPRVNTAVVKASAQRYARAAAAGRTYEEQLKWEQANGQDTVRPASAISWRAFNSRKRRPRNRRSSRSPPQALQPLPFRDGSVGVGGGAG